MKTLKLQPNQNESWRALMWGAYVTHIAKPDWTKYVKGIFLFPIDGHTLTDSWPRGSQRIAPAACYCNICIAQRTGFKLDK